MITRPNFTDRTPEEDKYTLVYKGNFYLCPRQLYWFKVVLLRDGVPAEALNGEITTEELLEVYSAEVQYYKGWVTHKPESIDLNNPKANMFGILPCPVCGDEFRWPSRDEEIICDNCGLKVRIAKE